MDGSDEVKEWGALSKIIRQQIEIRHKEVPLICKKKKKKGAILGASTMSEFV